MNVQVIIQKQSKRLVHSQKLIWSLKGREIFGRLLRNLNLGVIQLLGCLVEDQPVVGWWDIYSFLPLRSTSRRTFFTGRPPSLYINTSHMPCYLKYLYIYSVHLAHSDILSYSAAFKVRKFESLVEKLLKLTWKVLKENSIIDRSWSSAKLFIMQNYTDNANGNVPLTVENV